MRLIDKLLGKEQVNETEQTIPPENKSLRQHLVDSGWKLSSRDVHALPIYEKHCKDHSMSPNRWDAGDWLKEFRGLDEEARVDRLEAQRRDDAIER